MEPLGIPFLLAAGASQPKISIQRILEALVISVLAAVGASYLTVQKLDIKQELIQKQFDEQVKRRNDEVTSVKADIKATNTKQDLQYELIRTELQKIALVIERGKK